MTLRAQIVLLLILFLALILIVNTVRREKLQLKYALPWLACILVLAVLVAVPGAIEALAGFLGIQSPVNMVFFLGFVFSLAIIFILTVTLSRVTMRLRRLVQEVALMEKRSDLEQKEQTEKKEP